MEHETRPLQKEKKIMKHDKKKKNLEIQSTKDDEHPQRKSQSTKECNGFGLFAE